MVNPPNSHFNLNVIGWGIAPPNDNTKGDAILNAKTPIMTNLAKNYPKTELSAHGLSVGLPKGLMGNSEVGHLNIGAGRIVYQDIVRIELAVENNTLLEDSKSLRDALNRAKNVYSKKRSMRDNFFLLGKWKNSFNGSCFRWWSTFSY